MGCGNRIFFHGKRNFDGFHNSAARTCYRPKQSLSLHSILRSFIGLWVKIRQRNNFTCSNQILCRAADVNWWPVLAVQCPRKVCLIPIKHSFFRWWYTKAWKQSLYDSEFIATKTWKAIFDNLVETCIDWMSFNFKIKIF